MEKCTGFCFNAQEDEKTVISSDTKDFLSIFSLYLPSDIPSQEALLPVLIKKTFVDLFHSAPSFETGYIRDITLYNL